MAYKRFDKEDIVLSTDLVSTPIWTGNTSSLLFQSEGGISEQIGLACTSSVQKHSLSGDYYLDVYKPASRTFIPSSQSAGATGSEAISGSSQFLEVQFSIAYGDKYGSGSLPYNSSVPENTPTRTIFGQYRASVLGDEESEFYLSNDSEPSDCFIAITIDRARYKEKLMVNTIQLVFDYDGREITLVDNSAFGGTIKYVDSGRLYRMVESSSVSDPNSFVPNYYGYFLPDTGIILLDAKKVFTESEINMLRWNSEDLSTDSVVSGTPMDLFFGKLRRFDLQSEETVSSNYVFVRARNAEFNYSTNPSNITGSGELRHNIMINQPQSFITSVGLYNDNNDLLAVAKLSRPLVKDFTKEAIIRIKIDY